MGNVFRSYPARRPYDVPRLSYMPTHWALAQLGRIGKLSKYTG